MKIKVGLLLNFIFFILLSVLTIPSDKGTNETKNPQNINSKSSSPHFISSPPNSNIPLASSLVKAVLVKSWYSGGDVLLWRHINENWWRYGNTEVIIDYTSLNGVSSFTLQHLINVGADVVIISDAAGDLSQYSDIEKQALFDYCSLGHNLIGTFLVFQHGDTDNRLLAPLWGINDTIQYSYASVSTKYYFHDPLNYLFTNINEPYVSSGYSESQVPLDGNWITSGLDGAQLVGLNQDTTAIITQYNAGNFWSIYISNMPEYYGDSLDAQFLYNAITFNDQFTNVEINHSNRPEGYLLEQNFPNPFNPSTKIKYSIPKASNVVIKVFDILGNEIETLVSKEKQAGTYEITWTAEGLTSGIYLYQIQAEKFISAKKMILLK